MSPPPRTSPMRPSALRDLRAAWRSLKTHPLGLLLPSAGILLLEVAALVQLRAAYALVGAPWEDPDGWVWFVGLAAALQVAVLVLVAPLRAALVSVGAGTFGIAVRPLLRVPSLVIVEGAIAAAQALAWALVAAPAVVLAVVLVTHRAVTLAAVALAAGLVAAALAALVIRVMLAYAPYEAIVGGRGPVAALRSGFALGRGDRLGLAVLLLVGDALVLLGGLLCGAGALPGYPIAPLAVLHRWIAAREVR